MLLVDLRAQYATIRADIRQAIDKVFESRARPFEEAVAARRCSVSAQARKRALKVSVISQTTPPSPVRQPKGYYPTASERSRNRFLAPQRCSLEVSRHSA